MAARSRVAGDVRCPDNPRRLFVRIDPDTNLIEVLCRDCTRQSNAPVFHRYNILGELVETYRQRPARLSRAATRRTPT